MHISQHPTCSPFPFRPLQDPSTLVACRTLSDARALLDREHYGLGKVKDRIIQYLAVR